jgi:O-antigen ligase
MTLVEQGIIGLIIFLALSFFILIRGEAIYHQTKDLALRRIVLMVLLCTIVIDAFLIINDLIETDKVGPFFFICIAILVNIDLKNQRLASSLNTQKDKD